MRSQGGDGGAAAAAAPPTAPPRGANRAALLEQREKEFHQDALVVGPLVQVAYAEAWASRAGAAMSYGYGKQVLKRKLCHIGDGDKPDGADGFDPPACQTYRDGERKFYVDLVCALWILLMISCVPSLASRLISTSVTPSRFRARPPR